MERQDQVEIEKLRHRYAAGNNIVLLKRTYDIEFNIRPRPSLYWDEMITNSPFSPSDSITRDRIKTVVKMVPINKNNKVIILDVGAGYGFLERQLTNISNIEIHGIDTSSKAIERLKSMYKGDFKLGSALRLPYKKMTFDVVLLLELLEHFQPKNSLRVLKEARRVLKKDGFLIISVPINEGIKTMVELRENVSGHLRIYTEALILKELEICGFIPIKVVKLYAFKNFYTFKKILINFFPGFKNPNDLVILSNKSNKVY